MLEFGREFAQSGQHVGEKNLQQSAEAGGNPTDTRRAAECCGPPGAGPCRIRRRLRAQASMFGEQCGGIEAFAVIAGDQIIACGHLVVRVLFEPRAQTRQARVDLTAVEADQCRAYVRMAVVRRPLEHTLQQRELVAVPPARRGDACLQRHGRNRARRVLRQRFQQPHGMARQLSSRREISQRVEDFISG